MQLVFKAGQRYPLRTQTAQVTRTAWKPNAFTGEKEKLEFSGQELAFYLAVQTGKMTKATRYEASKPEVIEYCFMDGKLRDKHTTISDAKQQKDAGNSKQKIDFTLQQLADHFKIPEVPDVAAVQPEAYARHLETLHELEQLTTALTA